MADPASAMAALGLAANVGQMVEYALIIVSKSRKIHNSLDGVLSENRHSAVVTGNLYTASCTLSSYPIIVRLWIRLRAQKTNVSKKWLARARRS